MRTLTVSTLFRDTAQKGSIYRRPRRVPNIRLSGDWLAALGFTPGSRIAVQVSNGQLIIKPQ